MKMYIEDEKDRKKIQEMIDRDYQLTLDEFLEIFPILEKYQCGSAKVASQATAPGRT